MKFVLIRLLIPVVSIIAFGTAGFCQQEISSAKAEASEIIIRKQIITADIDRQVKAIPFAAVRSYVRFKLATWLWKDGKDETSEAVPVAVKAIEDLFGNRNEVPTVYFNALAPDLVALLERHAKDKAIKVREKYRITDDQLTTSDILLSQKDGDKLAVDMVIRSMGAQDDIGREIVYLLERLKERRSPELSRLLTALIQAPHSVRTKISSDMLQLISQYVFGTDTSFDLKKQFLSTVIENSINASVSPSGDVEGFFRLLTALNSKISEVLPEAFAEANIALAALKGRIARETREAQERTDRINSATDVLSTLVSEADQTANKVVQYELYMKAARLALTQQKFIYAVDLMEKGVDIAPTRFSKTVQIRIRDQFRTDVVESALLAKEPRSADYAIKKVEDWLVKSGCLRRVALFYFDNGDLSSARTSLTDAIKLVEKMDNSSGTVSTLVNLMPTAQKIDRTMVMEIGALAAKQINSLTTIRAGDKPGDEKYNSYITSIMIINWNLLPALSRLLKENKNAVIDLSERIDKKEIKIIADFVLMTDPATLPETKIDNKNKSRGVSAPNTLPK